MIARVWVPASTASMTACCPGRRPERPNTFVTTCAIRRRLSAGFMAVSLSDHGPACEIEAGPTVPPGLHYRLDLMQRMLVVSDRVRDDAVGGCVHLQASHVRV